MFSNWNIKKVCMYLAAVVIVSFVIGTMVMFSPSSENDRTSSSNYNLNDEKVISANGIKEIFIDNSSAQINIIKENRSDIKAHASGRIIGTSSPKLEVSQEGDKAVVSLRQRSVFSLGFSYSNLKLDVYIPDSFKENLKVNSSSGSLNINGFTLNDFSCKISSGSSHISNLNLNSFTYDSSSGGLTADSVSAKTSYIESSSGSVRLKGFKGDLKGQISSGSFRVEYAEFDNNIDIRSSSGSVEVDVPSSAEFYLNARASSGSVDCNFPITIKNKNKHNELEGVVGSDKNKITINASSGSIKIY